MLPKHGKLNCNNCFIDGETEEFPHAKWKMVNDPGSWGSSEPEILLLGFSKGATQANLYQHSRFEDVAFGGQSRKRLTDILVSTGILYPNESVSDFIANSNSRIAFGSLVRCSLSRVDDKLYSENNECKYLSSGNLIVKSFREIPHILKTCTNQFLTNFPKSLKLVILLGINKIYVKHCRELISSLHSSDFQSLSELSYKAGGVIWTHLPHPSPANGSLHNWLNKNSCSVKAVLKNANVSVR